MRPIDKALWGILGIGRGVFNLDCASIANGQGFGVWLLKFWLLINFIHLGALVFLTQFVLLPFKALTRNEFRNVQLLS